MATIKEIAEAANVSVATVSRYINKSGYVSEETAIKLKEVIEKFNYRPNISAQVLNKKSSKLIGLVVPDISNPFFTKLINGAEETAARHGYMIMIANGSGEKTKLEKYLTYFEQYNVAGILTADEKLKHHNDMKSVPVVYLDRELNEQKFYVGTDHEYGGKILAESILQTNFHKVLYISGPINHMSSKKRLESFEREFKQQELAFDKIFLDSFTYASAVKCIDNNIKQIIKYDTIVASNDLFALALNAKLQKHQLRVPEDVQIIGYDGIDAIQFTQPILTTVQQPDVLIGSKGCELLINLIEKKTIESNMIYLKPKLSEGKTLRKEE
ncbi:LacI family DNA-binding transcriptional regulator [Aerococcaceae bacterium DSM 111020]|nr:LacI family DNA-binding transcriptional regulator [Aerococcaceae bacterium DSM 111020]